MWGKKCCTAGHATAYHIIWRMRPACFITQAPKTHWEYVIFIALPLQQWLNERASMFDMNTMPNLITIPQLSKILRF
jgi:hypothetical protein